MPGLAQTNDNVAFDVTHFGGTADRTGQPLALLLCLFPVLGVCVEKSSSNSFPFFLCGVLRRKGSKEAVGSGWQFVVAAEPAKEPSAKGRAALPNALVEEGVREVAPDLFQLKEIKTRAAREAEPAFNVYCSRCSLAVGVLHIAPPLMKLLKCPHTQILITTEGPASKDSPGAGGLIRVGSVLKLASQRLDAVTDRGGLRCVRATARKLLVKRERRQRPRELPREPNTSEPWHHELAEEQVGCAQIEVE
jgi:hypothetical protein